MRLSNEERCGICCAGNWIIDHVKVIGDWPPEETLVSILSEEVSAGGAPYNVSVDLAQFGLDLPIFGLGLVGDDADGEGAVAQDEGENIRKPREYQQVNRAPQEADLEHPDRRPEERPAAAPDQCLHDFADQPEVADPAV